MKKKDATARSGAPFPLFAAGLVGQDALGEQILATCRQYKIDVRHLGTTPKAPTTPVQVILRSGAYLTHDHGFYGTVSPAGRGVAGAPVLRPALELWAQVLSRPEPGLALLGAGRRDVGFDQGLPVPLRVVGRDVSTADWQITELNDQHAYLRLDPGTVLAPGDLVCLGISHPCTTLDKWRLIRVLDDEDNVIGAVHTFF